MADELSTHDQIVQRQREETDAARVVPEFKKILTLEERVQRIEKQLKLSS